MNAYQAYSQLLFAKAGSRGVPLSGTFELTPRCNLDCRMCYIHRRENDAEALRGEASAREWLALAEECCREGTLLLLLMTLFLGVDQTQAQGINLLYFLPTAGMSLLEHRKNGYLDREVMRAAIPLGTLAALAAAWAATSVDITVFRKPFGVFLLWAGANMLLQKKK